MDETGKWWPPGAGRLVELELSADSPDRFCCRARARTRAGATVQAARAAPQALQLASETVNTVREQAGQWSLIDGMCLEISIVSFMQTQFQRELLWMAFQQKPR